MSVKKRTSAVYKRVDSLKDAVVRYRITPRTDLTYYFFVPASLNSERLLTLGGLLLILKRNTQRQLWQIADTQLITSVLSSVFKTDKVDLSNAGAYRAERSVTQSAFLGKMEGNTYKRNSQILIVGSVTLRTTVNI